MSLTSDQMVTTLAELAELPEYKVRRMFTQFVRIIHAEVGRGGTVDLPQLGTFRKRARRAKTVKNAIRGKSATGLIRGDVDVPSRGKLTFVPYPSKKFFPTELPNIQNP